MPLRTALAILTYVADGQEPLVRRRLPECLRTLDRSGYEYPVFIVDDGSGDAAHRKLLSGLSSRYKVIQRPINGGISCAKNTCLKVIAEQGFDLGFLAEDDTEFKPGWWAAYEEAYVRTGVPHFCWADHRQPAVDGLINGFRVRHGGKNGLFITFTPDVIAKVGGFKVMPHSWGYEHIQWTNRVIAAGLQADWTDIPESYNWIGINRFGFQSAVPLYKKFQWGRHEVESAMEIRNVREPLTEFLEDGQTWDDKSRSAASICASLQHKAGDPKCSIVIATRNKAHLLERTLYSIRAQQPPFAYEVLVVDDGSNDQTFQICQRYMVRYLRINNPEYRNPGYARNAGYRAAHGEIIITQSDEVIHDRADTIERLVNDLEPGEILFASVANAVEDPGGTPTPAHNPVVNVSPRAWYSGHGDYRNLFFLGSLWRRDIFAIGGNDPEFNEPCYEDDWFGDCLTKGLGLHPRYLEDVIGYHQDHPRPGKDVTKMKRLYESKVARAMAGEIPWCSSAGPWQFE